MSGIYWISFCWFADPTYYSSRIVLSNYNYFAWFEINYFPSQFQSWSGGNCFHHAWIWGPLGSSMTWNDQWYDYEEINYCCVLFLQINSFMVPTKLKFLLEKFDKIKNDDKTLDFLTGISNVQLFKWLFSLIKRNIELASKLITNEKHLLIVLMKLRQGYTNKGLVLLIQMLPISQTFSQLIWKPYQIFWETILYGRKEKHYVEIYHLLLKSLKTLCV